VGITSKFNDVLWRFLEVLWPFLVGESSRPSLDAYSPEANTRSARLIVSSVEGARFVSTDFRDERELIEDLDRLMSGS
jgi:hypothetical protein